MRYQLVRSNARACFVLLLLGCLFAPAVQAQVPLPHTQTDIVFDRPGDLAQISFDAGTLPARAHVEVTLVRPPKHPDLVVDVNMTCPIICPSGMSFDETETLGEGVSGVEFRLAESCAPYSPHVGVTCNVVVEPTDYGVGGVPVEIDVAIRGVTVVSFHTEEVEYDPIPQPRSIVFPAERDTTLYAQNPTWSNGQGESVWAGSHFVGSAPFGQSYALHGMMSFDVGAPLFPTNGAIPSDATIDEATLTLEVLDNLGFVDRLTLSEVIDDDGNPFSVDDWSEGTANAPGTEIEGVLARTIAATWSHRDYSFSTWRTPGAAVGPVIASTQAPAAGVLEFSSAELTRTIRKMHATRRDGLGFQIQASQSPFRSGDQAVRVASREHPNPRIHPELEVIYTPAFADPLVDPAMPTGTLLFVAEGEDFRWIYDDDGDDVVITDIGGRCEETADFEEGGLLFVPYNYSFQGDPSYQGLDCCTWQIQSPFTGTVGAGQAIFYLNVDPNDPANQPPDTDGDGIRDLCDNCPFTPNGPFLGSCMGGTEEGQLCRSNLECAGAGATCSLSQEDDDFAPPGIACPEPSFAGMLALGGLVLAWGRPEERRRC